MIYPLSPCVKGSLNQTKHTLIRTQRFVLLTFILDESRSSRYLCPSQLVEIGVVVRNTLKVPPHLSYCMSNDWTIGYILNSHARAMCRGFQSVWRMWHVVIWFKAINVELTFVCYHLRIRKAFHISQILFILVCVVLSCHKLDLWGCTTSSLTVSLRSGWLGNGFDLVVWSQWNIC